MPPRLNSYESGVFSVKGSTLVSRNVTVNGRRTSARLEPDMWNALTEICRREDLTLHEVCTLINQRKHSDTSLTAAIRVFIMVYFRSAATEEGHRSAGHGGGSVLINEAAERISYLNVPDA